MRTTSQLNSTRCTASAGLLTRGRIQGSAIHAHNRSFPPIT
ncbi:MAG: hypothetical protein ACRDYA_05010 [Egibacteraceae bacterium]